MDITWHPRTDVKQEEIDRYAALVVQFVREKKGWEPGEYHLQFITALADAPLAAFNVTPKSPHSGPGLHPEEMEVYVQTEEMRAFTGHREYLRLYEELLEKKKGKKP